MHHVLASLLLVLSILASSSLQADDVLERLSAAAPALDRKVLALALDARACAARRHDVGRRLAVIDYSQPSTDVRLWVFDVPDTRLLHAEHVAHGRGSGDNVPTVFSDTEGSYQSSLGLFRMSETYVGGNGYSLRMDGLEPGLNARARERLIVMHGADYVDPAQGRRQGRLGRSWGCPAVRSEVAQAVIDDLKDGQLLFAYADDPSLRRESRFLHCPAD
ncbi:MULTISPECIES: murein L,D-transpeptidase catalytic domain family protein [Luteimonas]|uniref:murein L,D-transpeptidase catalytic domain family protein n=1 Tax=Luteimonas TaxID=83614 RepID=UPI000C7D5971|nr:MULTISPECIES: murein L,D-transpeptidase catalytic domain family protein [Luteimonas]